MAAKLLPNLTTTEASLSIFSNGNPVTLAILAKAVAAASDVKLVVAAICDTVLVNFVISFIPTQSCHHNSAIFATSSKLPTISVDNCSSSVLNSFSSASLASTVLATQAKAVSNDIASSVAFLNQFAIPANNHNNAHNQKNHRAAFFICVHRELNNAHNLLRL